LGVGAIAHVVQTTHIATGKQYATKIVSKRKVLQEDLLGMVKMEKMVLDRLDHPNIIKLYGTYQDEEQLCKIFSTCQFLRSSDFVLELAPNGELFEQVVRDGPLSLKAAKFYTAELVSALSYMDKMETIHRDVKPENILLSETMHAKLSDFSTAIVKPDSLTEQPKLAGTIEFMCPETINRQELSHAVDIWALGCTVYFILAGKHAFRGDSEYDTFSKILGRELQFGEEFDTVAKDFLEKLLKTDPSERLGVGGNGYADIMAHAFFEDINFDDLVNVEPPPMR
jgi:3-phosphoinositide dependent protein kinase-1